MEKFYWEHWRGGDKCRRYWDQNPPIEGNSICIFVHLHSTGGGLSFHLCVVDKTPQSRLVQTDTPYSWGRLTEQLGLEGTSGDHAVHSGLSRWVWDVSRQGDSALPWAAVQGSATLMESSSSSHWVEFVIEFLWPLLLILLLNTTEKCCGSHFSVILDKGQCFIPAGNSWGSSEWVGIPSCSLDPWQCSVRAAPTWCPSSWDTQEFLLLFLHLWGGSGVPVPQEQPFHGSTGRFVCLYGHRGSPAPAALTPLFWWSSAPLCHWGSIPAQASSASAQASMLPSPHQR